MAAARDVAARAARAAARDVAAAGVERVEGAANGGHPGAVVDGVTGEEDRAGMKVAMEEMMAAAKGRRWAERAVQRAAVPRAACLAAGQGTGILPPPLRRHP